MPACQRAQLHCKRAWECIALQRCTTAEQAKGTAESRMTAVSDVFCRQAEGAARIQAAAQGVTSAQCTSAAAQAGRKIKLTVAPSRLLMISGVKKVKPLRQVR